MDILLDFGEAVIESGAAICLVSLAIPMLHIDKVIIGDIMLLIPGIAITMAVKDVLIGDTISGLT